MIVGVFGDSMFMFVVCVWKSEASLSQCMSKYKNRYSSTCECKTTKLLKGVFPLQLFIIL